MADKLDKILVIDLEATCWEGDPPPGQDREIIEIGLCLLDVATCQRIESRSLLVRPEHSTVSDYCTRLTTLTPEQVDAGVSLREACQILERDYRSKKRLWASYGDYDRKKLWAECESHGIEYPFGPSHLNVKSLLSVAFNLKKELPLDKALAMLGFPLEGTHHRGDDDAWNIARILAHILLGARGAGATHLAGALHLDQVIDRRDTDSIKWNYYGDALPLWVADMDFPAPEPVIAALRQRVEHGIFGYGLGPPELRPLLVERLQRLYGWTVAPEALLFVPGIVTGFNQAVHAVTEPGDGVLVQTPVYFPMLWAPGYAGCTLDDMELTRRPDGRYEIDFDRFEAAITERTRIFVLCNPHNPVGRVFRRDELETMAEICQRHDVVICADEIHNDLVYPGHEHVPIATLAPEIAARTITLMAPSKTYNIAGVHASVAIVENPELRKQFKSAAGGLVPRLDVLGYTALLAAYRDGQSWLDAVLAYLEANRDFLFAYVESNLPGVSMTPLEGTYLAWLDCREFLGALHVENAHKFFLEEAGVALNDGATFGKGGEGFVRLNFACPRATLVEALARMKNALERIES